MAQKRGILSKVYWLGPMGSRQINMKELNGMTPEQHAASIIKDGLGFFKRVNESTDHCMLPTVSPFIGDKNWYYSPKYAYYYSTVEDKNYIPIKLTSETTALLPSNRSRTDIGVGEEVTVKADQKISWKFINEHLVSISYQDQGQVVFSALDREGVFTAIAYTEDAENRISFGIKTPQSIDYVVLGLIHKKGILGAGFGLGMSLLPSSVNFSNVLCREKESYAKTGGPLFASEEGKPHGKYTNGYSEDFRFTHDGKINKSIRDDIVYVGQNEYGPPPFEKSTVMFPIDLEWTLNQRDYYPFYNTIQKTVIEANGNVTTSKGNQSVTFHYLDESVNESREPNEPKPHN